MQMQSSYTHTVGLCFLACKPSSFWSIFQENSVKHVFCPSSYCCFCQSYPMVCCIPHGTRGGLFGCLSLFPSEADWLSLWIFVTVAIKKAEQARDLHISAFIINYYPDTITTSSNKFNRNKVFNYYVNPNLYFSFY